MPPGPKRMVVGFNHNIKYRGKTYHAQTEDSGADNPQVATHLFLGGNIIASKRTSYADICGAENLPDVVRALMEEQHKEVLRNLVHGVYDRTTPLTTPARAFGPAPPPPPPTPPREVPVDPKDTLFGEDLISERSLDEVILAYLAGDVDGRKS
jgi:hypothetical protein